MTSYMKPAPSPAQPSIQAGYVGQAGRYSISVQFNPILGAHPAVLHSPRLASHSKLCGILCMHATSSNLPNRVSWGATDATFRSHLRLRLFGRPPRN